MQQELIDKLVTVLQFYGSRERYSANVDSAIAYTIQEDAGKYARIILYLLLEEERIDLEEAYREADLYR